MNLPAHFLSNPAPSPILNLTASACGSLFASAETDGWRIWDCSSLCPVNVTGMRCLKYTSVLLKKEIDTPNGSLSMVLPLHQTGLVFLVGGPPSPLYAPNKVILYSVIAKTACATFEFQSEVLGICARRDRLLVVLHNRVALFVIQYDPPAIVREGAYETADNPRGLGAIATEAGSTLLCFPGRQTGQVAIVKLPSSAAPPSIRDPPYATISILLAHTTSLSALAITPSGSHIATASNKGTLIRVYDPKTSTLLHELRRGTDTAEIFSLALRPDGLALACASDKGTIHLWDLSPRNHQRETSEEAILSLKPFLPKYFSSSWSNAQFKLPPPEAQPARSLPFLDAFADEKLDKPKTVEEDKVMLVWSEVKEIKEEQYKDVEGRKERKAKREKAKKGEVDVQADEAKKEYVLVAATHAGAWYKLAAFDDGGSADTDDSRAKEQARAKEQTAEEGYGAFGRCRRLDHKRFEQRDDDW